MKNNNTYFGILKIRYIFLSILVFLLVSCGNTDSSFDLVLFSSTDIHGSFFPFDSIKNIPVDYSLAHASYLLDELRKDKNNEVLYIDSGDYFQGDPVVDYFNQEISTSNTAVSMMNYLKPASVTVGNHDIERGHEIYDTVRKEYYSPWLAANVLDKNTKTPYFTPYVITNVRGITVAILGMLTPTTSHLPKYLWDNIEFEDIVESSKKWIQIIKEKENPDLIVGSFHSGLGSDEYIPMGENVSLYTALNVEGFDIIFKGHDHLTHLTNVKSPSGKDVIVLGGENALKTVTKITIPVTKQDEKWILGKPQPEIIYIKDQKRPVDKKFINAFQHEFDAATNFLAEPIGNLSKPISSKKSLFGPSEFIDTIHQLKFHIAEHELKMPVVMSIAAPLALIDISTNLYLRDLYGIYYYDNWPTIVELKGFEIKKLLESFLKDWFNTMKNSDDYLLDYVFDKDGKLIPETRSGGFELKKPFIYFNNIAGINFTIDLQKPFDERVFISTLSDGTPFQMSKSYKIIVDSFLSSFIVETLGITEEEMNKRILATSKTPVRSFLKKYIQESGIVQVPLFNNWKLIPEDWTERARKREYQLWFTNALKD
ncbi:MAG: bifunctional metallophosphatase/5'-nucleotidase [Brevinema sp.]